VQPTSYLSNVVAIRRVDSSHLQQQGSQGLDPAHFVTRGPLAARAHRLLGLGAAGSARLGQVLPALTAAFGGDVATWQRVGEPWIGARSLARPIETLSSQSSVSWLLGTTR
jgi:hypothetical protein